MIIFELEDNLMEKLKKLSAAVIALTMACGMMTACGSSDGTYYPGKREMLSNLEDYDTEAANTLVMSSLRPVITSDCFPPQSHFASVSAREMSAALTASLSFAASRRFSP